MSKELESVRLHYIYCVYGDSDGPVEEVRDFFGMDVGEDTNVYNATELAFYLDKDGEEYVKFFDDDSPFAPWNKAFKREGCYSGYNETCYFGMNYYDTLVPVEELEDIKNQIEKRRNELHHG
jgi:hypothetical protein